MIISLFGMLLLAGEIQSSPTDTLTVKVLGTGEDARYEPVILQAKTGDVIRFEVVEGVHTVTAYHPDNRRPQRIPEKARSFDSGMLTAGQTWFLKLDRIGVYDYFCLPHEKMGHAGRIMFGTRNMNSGYEDELLPNAVLKTLDKAQKELKISSH